MGRGARKKAGEAGQRASDISTRERFAKENLQTKLLREGQGDRGALRTDIASLPESAQQFTKALLPPAQHIFLRWQRALDWLRKTPPNALTENMWRFLELENGRDLSQWVPALTLGKMYRIEIQMRAIEGMRVVLEDPDLREVAEPLLEQEKEIRQEAALRDIPDAPVVVVPNRGWIDPRTEDEIIFGQGSNPAVGYATVASSTVAAYVFPEACCNPQATEASEFFRHVLTHELVHTGQSSDWSDRNNLDGMMARDHRIFSGHSERQADIMFELHEALTEHLHLLRTGRDDVCQNNNEAYWKQVEALREVLWRADIENEEQFVVDLQTVPPDVAVHKLDRALQRTERKFFEHWLEVSTPIAEYMSTAPYKETAAVRS